MPADWHEEALAAQTVAARTYALYQMHNGVRGWRWDIGSDQGSQMYLGLEKENPRVNQAIRETRGVVLTYGSAGREKIFPAYYCSNCGGHTQDAEPVFGEGLAPLRGKPCPYCGTNAPKSRYRWKKAVVEKELLSENLIQYFPELGRLGEITGIKVEQRSRYGRAEVIQVTGLEGRTSRLRAEDFRLVVNSTGQPVLSSWYELSDNGETWTFSEGHGWGHGVGLCQYGSQALARSGKSCQEILAFYYPESVLLRAY
jgi:stage II sporulation protein D